MWGITPPPAMVALMSVSSSSSPRICAKHRCTGAPRAMQGQDSERRRASCRGRKARAAIVLTKRAASSRPRAAAAAAAARKLVRRGGAAAATEFIRQAAYRKLQVARRDALDAEILGGVAGKLEHLGASKQVVGLTVPTGYSFNLDGTNIYLTMAALFVAQALNIELTVRQEVTLLLVAMLTSKGASGVTGAGFITLAATLAVVPSVPVAGLALILGIDRFMSEARALTNFIGNGVAAVVIARWEGELDPVRLSEALAGREPLSRASGTAG